MSKKSLGKRPGDGRENSFLRGAVIADTADLADKSLKISVQHLPRASLGLMNERKPSARGAGDPRGSLSILRYFPTDSRDYSRRPVSPERTMNRLGRRGNLSADAWIVGAFFPPFPSLYLPLSPEGEKRVAAVHNVLRRRNVTEKAPASLLHELCIRCILSISYDRANICQGPFRSRNPEVKSRGEFL